nr:Chain C, NPM6I variant peptide [synthetic construct]4HUU_F Chain F, NPM6I variant peptide [synthetic construct]4HV8_E Chain E, NPM6I variant peptide [synthetic construct]4HV8_F Chain F, NPM6I variant peptide [synthetic construct]
ASNENIETM